MTLPPALVAFFWSLPVQTFVGYVAIFLLPSFLPVVFVKLIGLGGLRDVLSYESGTSTIHRLDPRLKLLYVLFLGLGTVAFSWQLTLALLGLTFVGWALEKPPRRRIRVLLALGISPAVALIWSQALFHPPISPHGQPLVDYPFPWTVSWVGTDGISIAGMVYGLQQAARTLVTISASLLLIVSTSPSDIVWAFRCFRLPPRAGFTLAIALRFLPDLVGRLATILQAVQVRGLDLRGPGWSRPDRLPSYLGRVMVAIPLVTIPLLIGALRGTRTMALVADARGFGGPASPTIADFHETGTQDRIGAAVLLALLVGIILVVVLHTGVREGL